MDVYILGLLLVFCLGAQARPSQPECGYDSCNPIKEDMLNVHLVPHTHDDVGWLKTVDQYYYGDRNDIQNAGVQYIIDSVVQELLKDPSKRFIYVEIAFFARWWREQDEAMRDQVRMLVNQGRLEFILGGWCMNDEASTHYNAIIDQHTLGLRFLSENFAECGRPRTAWQVDPFGHSREQASLFAQLGYDSLFFGRLDYQDKNKRLNESNMEFVWKGSPNSLGETANLFTGVLFNGYGPPGGFNWNQGSGDDPMMDDKRLHDYNVEKRVDEFLKAVQDQAKHYRSRDIMMTMGSDFEYQNAHTWYKNLDKLIHYVNARQQNGSGVNLLYSTPSCYTFQQNHLNQIWNGKDDDFFPYASSAHTFWTGYFTSRPALKGYVRQSNNYLQVCKQLDTIGNYRTGWMTSSGVEVLKEAMGVAQHHDAVSGTEKQHVANDYAERLSNGYKSCENVTNMALKRLLPRFQQEPPNLQFCTLTNISKCEITENYDKVVLEVYNPLGVDSDTWVRLPVNGTVFDVFSFTGDAIPYQVIPVTSETKKIPERKGTYAQNELIFQLTGISPLGLQTVWIQKGKGDNSSYTPFKAFPSADFTMQNKLVSLTFDHITKQVKEMENLQISLKIPLHQKLMHYFGFSGNNSKDEFRASGAYCFRPNSTEPKTMMVQSAYIVQGDLVQEVHQVFPWASQVFRLYKDANNVEVEWTVGPIDISDKSGKEVISRYDTSLQNGGVFYTDANGREIQERKRNYRKTWNLNQTEPVAGNYYPVNSRIFIRDPAPDAQFTVLTDRSQGGSSVNDGQIELMVHRRLLHDDSFGVGEPLNETGADGKGLVVRGKHYLVLDTIKNSARQHRLIGLWLYRQPVIMLTNVSMDREQWYTQFNTQVSGLNTLLPENVHILTLEMIPPNPLTPISLRQAIVRLEHFYENGEDEEMSKPAIVDLQMFGFFNITGAVEMTLGANMMLKDLNRLQWRVMPSGDEPAIPYERQTYRELKLDSKGKLPQITLNPMEIKTFIIDFNG
ncbi:lysosomal alpha-mannosidase-like isoform X2 [Mytilus trossulus]|uniref:lysosomal alpha-mannosidase-like isoform X2 n=1 Tax=Mytilus trossulus TaxID=6551 RepID=UPI0030068B8A